MLLSLLDYERQLKKKKNAEDEKTKQQIGKRKKETRVSLRIESCSLATGNAKETTAVLALKASRRCVIFIRTSQGPDDVFGVEKDH